MTDKYRYALGVPGEGIHFHVFGVAIMDIILTLVAAIPISYFTGQNYIIICVILFAAGFFLHWLFDVPTAMMTSLGLVKK